MVSEDKRIKLKDISLSLDETYHIYNNKPLYSKKFDLVMSFHSPGVAAVRSEDGAFHINLQGSPVYKNRFIKTFGFYGNIAGVEDESGWYHINLYGNSIYSEKYDWVGNFQEGLCPVRDHNGDYFHIEKDGSPAYSEKYRYAGDFKYGIAVVYRDDGLAMHIDRNGNNIHEKNYEELGIFHKGFAVAKDNRGAFHINKTGEQLYKERYRWIEPFYNNFSLACRQNGEKVVIDQEGIVIFEIMNDKTDLVQKKIRTQLMGMLVGYWDIQILFSIVKLNVLDYIKEGFNIFRRLLKKVEIPEQSMEMIIKVLKVWNFIGEREGKYFLTYLGNLLTEDYPNGLKYAALMWGDEHYLAMSRLFEALKSYEPQFKELYKEEIFHYFNTNEEKGVILNKAMAEYGLDYDKLLNLYDFKESSIIMDVGGGSGHLLEKILKKFENIKKGILFDLPSVIENAMTSINMEEISNKIEFVPGDFFDKIPIKIDTVVMSRVMHDWNDEKTISILKNIYDALIEDGKLLLFETIVPENLEMDVGVTLNFNLLVCVGGKERTLEEFNTLLKKVNFKITSVKQEDGIISLIEAQKIAQ